MNPGNHPHNQPTPREDRKAVSLGDGQAPTPLNCGLPAAVLDNYGTVEEGTPRKHHIGSKITEINDTTQQSSFKLRLVGNLRWILLTAFFIAAVMVIWRNPVAIGGDEGMELSKELLVAKQPLAIHSVWNDQEWFFSLLFGQIFRAVGYHPAIPRLFALLCATAYCISLRRLMPNGAGALAHLCAILVFLCYPTAVVLSMSGMLELPATVLALMGAQSLILRRIKRNMLFLLLGGMLVGMAIQIKLTAGMAFGAATIAFTIFTAASYFQSRESAVWKQACVHYLIWFAGVAVSFCVLAWLSPEYSFDHLWASHVRASSHIPADQLPYLTFGWKDLFVSGAVCAGFVLGIGWILKLREPAGPWLLPVCYGVCLMAIHSTHRPFWQYYYIHFAAAFAPITGWFFIEMVRVGLRAGSKSMSLPILKNTGMLATIGGAALISFWAATDLKETGGELSGLLHCEPASKDPIVKLLRDLSPQVKLVFSRDNSTVAAAGLVMVPELTVLPKKRFWDGFTEKQLLAIITDRKPEVIILGKTFEEKDARWRPVLQASYRRVLESDTLVVYVSQTIKLPRIKSAKEQLKLMGL
ncbi:MAG TPA: hypothetical protein VFB79_02110 [Candidatus Angelobacter sp.]|nr:hypothetical protein [Candidatus Angelobacter sp.]